MSGKILRGGFFGYARYVFSNKRRHILAFAVCLLLVIVYSNSNDSSLFVRVISWIHQVGQKAEGIINFKDLVCLVYAISVFIGSIQRNNKKSVENSDIKPVKADQEVKIIAQKQNTVKKIEQKLKVEDLNHEKHIVAKVCPKKVDSLIADKPKRKLKARIRLRLKKLPKFEGK